MVENKKPLISVILTTYNRKNLLKKTVDSILVQTFGDFELIIVDNYSNYDFFYFTDSFNDNRIRPFQNKNNGIIAVNRNFGIKRAVGKYIAFCDDDDTWYPEKLSICRMHFNDKNDLIYHDLKIVGNPRIFTRKVLKGRRLPKPVLIDLLINSSPIANSSVIVKKSIIDKIGDIAEKKEMVAAEDFNTWLRIAEITDEFLYVPKILGEYLHQEESMSQKSINHSISFKFATNDFLHCLNNENFKRYKAWENYFNGRFLFLSEEWRVAKTKLFHSMRFGNLEIKIKSLYMIMICSINQIIKR